MATGRVVIWAIVIGVGLVVAFIGYAAQPGGATSAYEAGRQLGYAAGQGLIAAAITYFVLRWLSRRSRGA